MQRIANYEDEQLGRGDCSAKCQNFSATEKNRRRIAPKLANEKEEASGESDNEWARMRRSPERSHSQGTTHATSFTASLFKEPRKIQIQIRLRLRAQIKLQTQMFIAKTNDTIADLLLHSQRKI